MVKQGKTRQDDIYFDSHINISSNELLNEQNGEIQESKLLVVRTFDKIVIIALMFRKFRKQQSTAKLNQGSFN